LYNRESHQPLSCNFRTTPSKAQKKDGEEEHPGEPITNLEQQLRPGRHVYFTDGRNDSSMRYAGHIIETDYEEEEAVVVFYSWPPPGNKQPRGWTYDPKYKWRVDFENIHSNLLEPTEENYTSFRKIYIFPQLKHLVGEADSGAL